MRNEVVGETTDLRNDLVTQGGIIKIAEKAKNATEQNYKAVLEIHRHREAQLQEYASGELTALSKAKKSQRLTLT